MNNTIVIKIIASLLIGSICVSCNKETETYKNQYDRNQAMSEAQISENQSTDVPKIVGTGVSGALAGAGVGAAVGSVIPGVGTTIGAIIGGVTAGVGGAAFGFQLAAGDMSEYIKVSTNFIFAQSNTEAIQTMVYGTGENEQAYFLPIFKVGDNVTLKIEMNTTLLAKAEKASAKQKSTDLLIPVEVSISKSKNVEVTYDGGIQKEAVRLENDIEGVARYSFYIKNNPELQPALVFTFTPASPGKAEVNVTYGTPDYKIVDSMCDVFQTVKFIE